MSKYLLRALTTTCLMTVAVALTVPAHAKEAAKAKPAKEKSHQFTGTIEALDATAGTCTVKSKKESKTFKCAPDCKMTKDDGTAFAVGDKVVVKFTGEGDAAVCQSISTPKPPVKKEKKEKKADDNK